MSETLIDSLKRWFIWPADTLTDREQRRKAKLLSSLLLFLIPLIASVILVSAYIDPATASLQNRATLAAALTLSFTVLMYGLSRTRYYQAAACLSIAGFIAAVLYAAVPQDKNGGEIGLLTYLTLPVLFGSVLFSWKVSLKILGLVLVGLAIFPEFVLDGDYVGIANVTVYTITVSVSSLITAYSWGILESDRRAELMQNEQMLRMTTDNMQDIVALLDEQNIYRYISPSLERITGFAAVRPGQTADAWVSYIHHDDKQKTLQHFYTVLNTHTPNTFAYRFQHARGHYLWFETIANPLIDARGKPAGVIFVTRDITGRKEHELHMLQLALQNERIATLERFISTMSHDLKTPISVINTSIYLLEKQPSPEKRQHRLAVLKHQAEHMERLVEDMLTIVRLDNEASYEFAPIRVYHLLHSMEKRFSGLAAEKCLTLTLEVDPNLPEIRVDSEKITLALAAIMQNALAFTPSGGTITLYGTQQNQQILLEIRDTGTGIAEKDLPYIFERFFRADAARSSSTGGTGLGLSIARKIIDAHAGKIEAISTPGKGSTFRITLPLAEKCPLRGTSITEAIQ